MRDGMLCVVKGAYNPFEDCVEAESVSLLRDELGLGDPMWE
jgi:hypothetical protein